MSMVDGLNAIAFVAERKIEEAIAEGQLDNLPGTGKPLELEDLSHLPEDMRMAYTILRGSGHLEETIAPGKAVNMADMMARIPEEGRFFGKMERLKIMLRKMRKAGIPEDSPYMEKVLKRV